MPNGPYWTHEEVNILLNNYNSVSKNEILTMLPRRTWLNIMRKAESYGIKNMYHQQHTSNFLPLLKDNNESYYWIGFLLADGCLTRKKLLKLSLSIKDLKHLEKFAKLINTNILFTSKKWNDKEYLGCTTTIMDLRYIDQFIIKFDFKNQKSYNPPSIEKLPKNDDLFLSLFIGFIDGDGCIYSNTNSLFLSIQIHYSWLEWLNCCLTRLKAISKIKINKARLYKKYAIINIHNKELLYFLKEKTTNLNLPILERKWNKISN